MSNQASAALLNDEFTGQPSKRALAYVQGEREKGRRVIGTYCGYAPLELFRAMGGVPAVLCAFANKPIEAAEAVLPANLCPLIKSSFGYIMTDTCPFFGLSDAVVAETTCDGKKKMFELIAHKKPMFVMDLPQLPDHGEAKPVWAAMIRRLQGFLESTFQVTIHDADIQAAIKDTNRKNRLMNRIFDYAACDPCCLHWSEVYDLTFLAQPASGADMEGLLEGCLAALGERKAAGLGFGRPGSPRVLITGCPVGGDATKVFKVIEEAGGVIVGIDNCTGMKAFLDDIPEDTPDPALALAERYLKLPCACMSPNARRLAQLDALVSRFRPDCVIDVILHACHGYNVESYRVREHIKAKGLGFLKVETDYADSDVKQIRTRVEALFETL